MKSNVECVFVTVPFTDTNKPLMAPAILKSVATQAGKTSVTIDLNIKFIKQLESLTSLSKKQKILDFFRNEKWDKEISNDVFDLLKNMAEEILYYKPKIVGISVFTYNCQACAKYLSWTLKKIDPAIKIIFGGAGILHHLSGPSKFVTDLKKSGVIDHYIFGDGEKVLYEYLKNNTEINGLSENTWDQLSNQELESLPPPDYDDYDFELYSTPRALPINGSRGCVRHCDFCDVHEHWKKFSYRGGQHIFNEMLTLSKKYGVNYFNFTDSLINGNLKEYRILMKLISDYNKDKSENDQFKWASFFIIRPRTIFTDDDWRLTSEGGGRGLAVGIETLSDTVRKKLGKNFTNDDIDYAFQSAQKYGKIKFALLFLTGHVYETDQDHEFELQWWPKQVKYKDVIETVNTGSPLGILKNTPLDKNFAQLGLISVGPNPEDWMNPTTNNTPQKRVKWNDEIVQTVIDCGFKLSRGHDAHYILERLRHNNHG
jgi:Radical SAM superfamily